MTWKAHVEASFLDRTARLHIADVFDNGTTFVNRDGTVTFVEAGAAAATHDNEPIEVPVDALHALFAAIGQHLGAVESPVALRRDYDAERARVDRLIAHITGGNA